MEIMKEIEHFLLTVKWDRLTTRFFGINPRVFGYFCMRFHEKQIFDTILVMQIILSNNMGG